MTKSRNARPSAKVPAQSSLMTPVLRLGSRQAAVVGLLNHEVGEEPRYTIIAA